MTVPLPPTGVFWRAKIFERLELSVPPSFTVYHTFTGGPVGLVLDGLGMQFDGAGTSTASVVLSVPAMGTVFRPPGRFGPASIELEVPPGMGFAGAENYSRTLNVSVAPSFTLTGVERYLRGVTLSTQPGLAFTGHGLSREENTNRTNHTVPAWASGCYVTLIGGGAAGGTGGVGGNAFGGGGGGGGGRIDRVWIPKASLGSTYTVVRGTAGTTAGGNAAASTFSSGSVSLSAGGGAGGATGGTAGDGGAGGTCSASGVSATTHNGTAGGSSISGAVATAGGNDTTNNVGCGGGGGGYA